MTDRSFKTFSTSGSPNGTDAAVFALQRPESNKYKPVYNIFSLLGIRSSKSGNQITIRILTVFIFLKKYRRYVLGL